MIEYWVGVDGGGTHTRARIRDRTGKLLGEGRAAGSNLELGIALAHGNVLAAIEQARIEAGLAEDAQQRMGVGWRSPPPSLADCYHAMLT
uniref:BadF/BadG/BcrA/BcrD ATPase family protein n=1 Tax=Aeromonas hydrophila TaxID=644 RepID=UPI000492F27F